jgi:II/X family phage/plasmid replication protein
MNEQIALTSQEQMTLPRRLRGTYILWKNGEDLRQTMPKQSFYRHRKELKEYGIDITLRCDSINQANVIPLVKILEARPVNVPQWAFDQGLVHASAKAYG